MNICQLAKVIKGNQTAYSKELGFGITCDENVFYYIDEYGTKQTDAFVECNFNVLLTTGWEIEIQYVDFWTAWEAAKNEGRTIKCENSETYYIYEDGIYPFTKEMIDGRWQIMN